MNDINNLSKSDSYLEALDMDRLTESVQFSLECTPNIAAAVAKLISAKIYLELVCEEEDSIEFLDNLDKNIKLHHVTETETKH
jgi:hypothetical protein|tara:strand:+ start:794 stop:1042 length:249 start_codon:yes stop_codon:yes gene_type:complete